MRSLPFAVILLLCATSFCADQPQTADQVQAQPFTLLALNNDQQPRTFTVPQGTLPQLLDGRVRTGNDLCYTMRSLYVRRDPDSDITRYRGRRTCTPAARFKVKPKQ